MPERRSQQGPDGYFGGSIKLTYESLVQDNSDGSKRFVRCIENLSNVTAWTEWKGLLSASDIAPAHRLYGSIRITGRNDDPKFTDLWWGDQRDKKLRVQAKCYQGEAACSSRTSFLDEFIVRSAHAQQRPSSPLELLDRSGSVTLISYQEFFLRDPKDGAPTKFAILARSTLARRSTMPPLMFLVSANPTDEAKLKTLPGLVVRFTTDSQALFGTADARELLVPRETLFESAVAKVARPFADANPPGQLGSMDVRTVFVSAFFREREKMSATVPLAVFVSSR